MKVVVKSFLNIRVGEPSTEAQCYQYLAPGSEIEVDGKLYTGKSFDNNDQWYKDAANNYYWSGGVTKSESQEWFSRLKIGEIWDKYKAYGQNVKIAVIDSGYSIANPDVSLGVVGERNFVSGVTIEDDIGHGTHCASIIGGRNKFNVVGCCPDAQLYIAKITHSGVIGRVKILTDAINWAVEQKVDIISLSFGVETNDPDLAISIRKAYQNNIIVIASIGNWMQGKPINSGLYPALYSECIAVGACDYSNNLSNIGFQNTKTEIYGPGENIVAYSKHLHLEGKSGTSQAAAIVTGVCALALSKLKKDGKLYNVSSFKQLLLNNSNFLTNSLTLKCISPAKLMLNI